MLYDHQKRIIDDDPKRALLALGTGAGKTRTALHLAKGTTLVVTTKTVKLAQTWEREAEKIGCTKPTVMSKEVFSKNVSTYGWREIFDTVILDEAHRFAGVSPDLRWRKGKSEPKASALFDSTMRYLEETKPSRRYLLTATPMRSPMGIYGLSRLLGNTPNFYEFRSAFYVPVNINGHERWLPKKDEKTKERLAAYVRRLGYVGRLEDFFDVPQQTFIMKYVDLTREQQKRIRDMRLEYPEPIVRVGKVHQIENGVLSGDEFTETEYFKNEKVDALLDLAAEFPRMVVFAKYRAQIAQYEEALTKDGYRVWVITGDVKDRDEVLHEAQTKDGILLVQAQISEGWELPDTPVMVFASKSYSITDYIQSLGRIQRANNIKKNLYVSIVARGGVDEAVEKAISTKQDFSERIYAETRS